MRDILFIDDILDAMEKIYLNRGSLKKGVCLNIGGERKIACQFLNY